jgi:hypothetical protein
LLAAGPADAAAAAPASVFALARVVMPVKAWLRHGNPSGRYVPGG